MAKFLVEISDPETGEILHTDKVKTNRDWYTEADYIFDCEKYEEPEWVDTVCSSNIRIERIGR